MKFTIVFPTHEATDLSLAAVFVSCLVWKEGDREILTPHRNDPHYQPGDLQQVLGRPEFQKRISDTCRSVTVVCHPTGNGTESHLKAILEDLGELGFKPQVVRH